MAVDPSWLARVRYENQQHVGLAGGMGGMGDAATIVASFEQAAAQQAAAANAPPPVSYGVPILSDTTTTTTKLLYATAAGVAVVGIGTILYFASKPVAKVVKKNPLRRWLKRMRKGRRAWAY